MPRRREPFEVFHDNITELIETTEIRVPHKKKCGLVGDKLKIDYFEMCAKLDIKLECPICMEQICCRNCYALSNCGNSFHLGCYIKNTGACPICRS